MGLITTVVIALVVVIGIIILAVSMSSCACCTCCATESFTNTKNTDVVSNADRQNCRNRKQGYIIK